MLQYLQRVTIITIIKNFEKNSNGKKSKLLELYFLVKLKTIKIKNY